LRKITIADLPIEDCFVPRKDAQGKIVARKEK
jgi:hypothetical protein